MDKKQIYYGLGFFGVVVAAYFIYNHFKDMNKEKYKEGSFEIIVD